MAFSLHMRILGEGWLNHSTPAVICNSLVELKQTGYRNLSVFVDSAEVPELSKGSVVLRVRLKV